MDMIEKMLKEKVSAFFYRSAVAQWCSAPLEIEGWLRLKPHWRHCVKSFTKTLYPLLSISSSQETSLHD